MLIIKFSPGFITKSQFSTWIYQTKDGCNVYAFDSVKFHTESEYNTLEDYFSSEFQILNSMSESYYKVWLADIKMAEKCKVYFNNKIMIDALDEVRPYEINYDKVLCIFEEHNHIYFTFIQGHRLFSMNLHESKLLPRYRELQLNKILKN